MLFVSIIHRTFVPQKNLTMSEKNMFLNFKVNANEFYNEREKSFSLFSNGDMVFQSIEVNLNQFPKEVKKIFLPSNLSTSLDIVIPDTVESLNLSEQYGNPFIKLNIKETNIKRLNVDYHYAGAGELDGEMLPEGLEVLRVYNATEIKNLNKLTNLKELRLHIREVFLDGEIGEDNALPNNLKKLTIQFKILNQLQRKNMLPNNLQTIDLIGEGYIQISKDFQVPPTVETFLMRNHTGLPNFTNSNIKHLDLSVTNIEELDCEMLPKTLEILQMDFIKDLKNIKNFHLLSNLKALSIKTNLEYIDFDDKTTLPESLQYLDTEVITFVKLCSNNLCPKGLKYVNLYDVFNAEDNFPKDFVFPEHIEAVFVSHRIENDLKKLFPNISINPKQFKDFYDIHVAYSFLKG